MRDGAGGRRRAAGPSGLCLRRETINWRAKRTWPSRCLADMTRGSTGRGAPQQAALRQNRRVRHTPATRSAALSAADGVGGGGGALSVYRGRRDRLSTQTVPSRPAVCGSTRALDPSAHTAPRMRLVAENTTTLGRRISSQSCRRGIRSRAAGDSSSRAS